MRSEKIHIVEHKILGLLQVVKSFIIEGTDLVLVDTGLNIGSANNIIRKLEDLDYGLRDVDICILTHSHSDHIGGLRKLKESGQPFLVAAHDAEIDDIEASTGVGVDMRLDDGQRIGGIEVIYLPGHTLGSIALLVGDTLITGDALNGSREGLRSPNPVFTKDRELGIASVQHLATYDFDKVYVSHGQVIESGGKDSLSRLISTM